MGLHGGAAHGRRRRLREPQKYHQSPPRSGVVAFVRALFPLKCFADHGP
jgi:hypothetical protein